MRINWTRAILAGVVATIVFDVLGLLLSGQWWNVPGLLSTKLGAPLAAGVAAHYANGVILAIIYAALAPSLWGPGWVRALTYITAQTVFGVWLFMLPLLGMGPAGLGVSAMVPVMTLVSHWGYGLALAWLYPFALYPLAQQAPSAEAGCCLPVATKA